MIFFANTILANGKTAPRYIAKIAIIEQVNQSEFVTRKLCFDFWTTAENREEAEEQVARVANALVGTSPRLRLKAAPTIVEYSEFMLKSILKNGFDRLCFSRELLGETASGIKITFHPN